MAKDFDYPSKGYALVDIGAKKGTGARTDYENDVYMRKAAEKLNKKDRARMRVTAQEQGKKVTKKKSSDKKLVKKISAKR